MKVLMKGNEAIGEAAIRAGCTLYFGYPITPQNEIPEYMSRRLPTIPGGAYIQAETEVAAINMVYGAVSTGRRAFTSSSSPGISLMMEGMSYLAGAELPCLVVNVMRGGPGLGNINPEQADYFQATKGGRPRQLPGDRAGAGVGPGDGRPHGARPRPRGQVPQPGR